ncbi:MAG: hypothetical protein IJX47_01390 [Clostridia bacterium]|nr:hypothetical protein [Clostridia bacterium]
MEDKNQNESFSFTYSAKEQKEIQSIRNKYAPQSSANDKESMMAQLRALDRSVTRKGTLVSLTIGIIGTLLLGFGMSLVTTDLSDTLGIGNPLVPGVLIGLAGIGIAALSYPVFAAVTRRERARIAPEILRLSDELLK